MSKVDLDYSNLPDTTISVRDVFGIDTDIRMQRRTAGSAIDTDRPCRAMAGDRLLLVTRDLAVGEAGEVIIALVVFLHVLEAEEKEGAFRIPPHGRAVIALFRAAIPLAHGGLCLLLLGTPPSGPDAVEIFGIKFHAGQRKSFET